MGSTVLATSSSSKYLKKRAYSGSVFARSETAGAAAAAGLSADMKTAPAASLADPPKRLRRERDFSDIEHLVKVSVLLISLSEAAGQVGCRNVARYSQVAELEKMTEEGKCLVK